MCKRFVAIWFRHLKTDWMIRRQPELKDVPFVLAFPDHGRIRITEVSAVARAKGIHAGTVVADAKVILPDLQVFDDKPGLADKLLNKLCLWCIKYTPVTTVDPPYGLILDVSGCAHLWGGEEAYLRDIINKLKGLGYHVLRRRFGQQLLLRLDQALGNKEEIIQPLIPVEPYSERLPCLEPIQTATGIEIALQRLLEILYERLQQEGKGLRVASFKCYRIDEKMEQIEISTNHASNNVNHLFKLFELKIATIEPAFGIELFTLEALKVEDILPSLQTFWTANSSLECRKVSELLDRLESKLGNNIIHRYLPDEHHLPKRSIKLANSLKEKPTTQWRSDKLRPIQLLHEPQLIEVTAPIPDYPPMNFRYKGKLHKVKKADGPERIEPEWWLDAGLHRDYYTVEDEEGKRY